MKRCIASLTRTIVACALVFGAPTITRAEDGYDLWLRYRRVADATRLAEYRAALQRVVIEGDSPTLRAARDELVAGLTGLLGRPPIVSGAMSSIGAKEGVLIIGMPASSPLIASLPLAAPLEALTS